MVVRAIYILRGRSKIVDDFWTGRKPNSRTSKMLARSSLFGAMGIRVNAVVPGAIHADMSSFTKTEAGRGLLGAVALFLLGCLGLLISDFPYIIPPSLTIWQAASVPATQIFALMGTLVLLPMIVGHGIFVYWIFGGKLREGEGYH